MEAIFDFVQESICVPGKPFLNGRNQLWKKFASNFVPKSAIRNLRMQSLIQWQQSWIKPEINFYHLRENACTRTSNTNHLNQLDLFLSLIKNN